MDNARESWLQYKNQLEAWNSQGKQSQQTEQEKQAQLQSDARIKGYITSALDDSILARILGISLITEGAIPENLGRLYFIDRLRKRTI